MLLAVAELLLLFGLPLGLPDDVTSPLFGECPGSLFAEGVRDL